MTKLKIMVMMMKMRARRDQVARCASSSGVFCALAGTCGRAGRIKLLSQLALYWPYPRRTEGGSRLGPH